MERGNNYNFKELHELEQLREQLDLLNKKLDNQKIFAEKALADAMRQSVSRLNKFGRTYLYFGIFAILFCSWSFHNWGMSEGFVCGTALFLILCVVVTYYGHQGLLSSDVSNGNLVELSSNVLRLKKIYGKWLFFAVPAIIVWFYFLYLEALQIYDNPEPFLYAALVGGTIGGVIGLTQHFKVVREVNKLLSQIHELKQME